MRETPPEGLSVPRTRHERWHRLYVKANKIALPAFNRRPISRPLHRSTHTARAALHTFHGRRVPAWRSKEQLHAAGRNMAEGEFPQRRRLGNVGLAKVVEILVPEALSLDRSSGCRFSPGQRE